MLQRELGLWPLRFDLLPLFVVAPENFIRPPLYHSRIRCHGFYRNHRRGKYFRVNLLHLPHSAFQRARSARPRPALVASWTCLRNSPRLAVLYKQREAEALESGAGEVSEFVFTNRA